MKMASRSVDLNSKKTNFSRAAHFFDSLCRCFAPPQSPFVRLKRQTCRMCLKKILFPVSMFDFIFSLPGDHFHLAASFSHFLTAATKYSCFSSNEIRLPSSFSVIQVSVNIKTNVQKHTASSRQTSSVKRSKNHLRSSRCIRNGHVTREKRKTIAAWNHGKTA